MKTALFLGAGASKFAGMPTTSGLIQKVTDRIYHHEKWESPRAKLLAANTVSDYRDKDVEELYHAIEEMLTAEKLHQKVVNNKMRGGGVSVVGRTLQPKQGNLDTIDETADIDENINTLKSLKTTIRNTLLTTLMVKQECYDDVVTTYDELLKCLQPRDIVTTNYDNVVETYCEQKEVSLENGFKASPLGHKRTWTGDWGDGYDGVRLTKTHGSITWQKGVNDTVLEVGEPGLRDEDRDVLITPTLGEKDYSDSIFPNLVAKFENVLINTKLLVVVGFSFRDPGINRMLLDRLRVTDKNPSPMGLLWVDPDPTTEKIERLLGPKYDQHGVNAPGVGLLNYYQSDTPHVYVYEGEFGPSGLGFMKPVLDYLPRIMK